MSERIHVLAQSLLGKSTLDDCSLTEVRALAQRYPYYPPAQFLFLHKLQQERADEYGSQLQKAILFYPDPVQFQAFIHPDRFYTEWEETSSDITSPAVVEEAPVEAAPVDQQPVSFGEDDSPALQEDENNDSTLPPAPVISFIPAETLKDTGLTFEPFHTVDYFASQGIRLSQEEASKDKFGKQLKSFTEWLKTMKRLPPTQLEASTDKDSEKNVQHLAQDSIHEANVWTEAMAEVWVKQGNRQKAIEVYNKLSLQNPSKKAYFAAKIENLKRS